ncbi:hypothetical protein HWV62_1917 [Athelia sp. TMB]|nr:hypothetical protein HWV62_1917 [Athelia sp. TMB]
MPMDLTTGDGVRMYLTAYLALDVRSGGGYCNFSWRAKLESLYEGQVSIVVKYAAPFTSWDRNIELGVERLAFEYKALKILNSEPSVIAKNSLVAVPAVYHYDPTANALIMQDVGSIPTLHALLRDKPLPPVPMAEKISNELAAFIAGIHNWGRNNQEARASLSHNLVGRTAIRKLCYETLVPKAEKSGVDDPLLQQVAAALSEEVMNSEETLVMGDFWTANVMIDVQVTGAGVRNLRKIWVIDWEGCRYGSPAADIASFAGDSYLVARLHHHDLGETLRHSFLETYAGLAKVDPFRVALGLGAHWIMWTDDLSEQEEGEIRECVDKGVEYIHRAWEQSAKWISLSLAKELVT